MLEWNYTEVISALITSPQPPMLFRSIKPIKVQTSSKDKAALPQQKYCLQASEKAEVFLWHIKVAKMRKTPQTVKSLNPVRLTVCNMGHPGLPKQR